MAGNDPKNRCPSCNQPVEDEHSDALECDAVSPTQPSHWWHRECLEASHFLGGKPVPIYAALVQFLHGKTYMFRCHMCDRNKPPLPVQLFEQNIIDKEQLIKNGAYTKEVRQYLKDHGLEELPPKKKSEEPPVSHPQTAPVTTATPTVVTSPSAQPPLVSTADLPTAPKVHVSGVPEVPPPGSEVATSSAGLSDTHVAASSAFVAPEKPNDLAITEVDRQHNISQESLGADLFGTPPPNPQPPFNFPTSLSGASVTLPPGGIHRGQVPPQILAQANQELVQSNVASGGVMSHGGGVGPMSQAPGQMQNAPVIPQQYQPPANMYYNPAVPPPQHPAPVPYSDPSVLIQMMQQQQQMFLQQQNQMYERMERERRSDEERRRQDADRRDKEQREFMERVLQTQTPGRAQSSASTTHNPPTHSGFAKPKFKLSTFHGDVLEWTSYWDMFVESVHNNPNFTVIDKLHALFESLDGRAKQAVANYKLEARNYQAVIDVLKDRFDDKIKIKSAHLQALITLQAPRSPQPAQLQTFLDSVNLHARGLVTGENGDAAVVDAQCMAIVPCLFEKLPVVIRSQVYDAGGREVRTHLSIFSEALKTRVKVQESIYGNSWNSPSGQAEAQPDSGSGSGTSFRDPPRPGFKKTHPTGATLLAPETTSEPPGQRRNSNNNPGRPRLPCLFCGTADHRSTSCPKFSTFESRQNKLRENKMCCFCLKKDHPPPQCPNKGKYSCWKCEERSHHSLLCPVILKNLQERLKKPKTSPKKTESGQLTVEVKPAGESACALGDSDVDHILRDSEADIAMQTAVVTIRNPQNNTQITANILYDTGCKRTYISQKIASALSLEPHKKCWRSITTFNAPKSRKVQAGISDIQLQGQDGSFIQLTGNIIDHIANSVAMDGFLLSNTDKSAVKKLKLADPHFSEDRLFDIDVVIGSDFYAMLLCGGKRLLQKSGVFLLETSLGWVTSGIIRDSARLPHSTSHSETENLALFADESRQVILEEDSFSPLEDLWKFETLGIKDPKVSNLSDHIALNQFNDSVKFSDGRVQVTWLKKSGIEELPSNFNLVFKRFQALLKMLRKNPQYQEKYIKNFADWFEREIVEVVTREKDNPKFQKHYIPHHAVFKYDSKTTKMRIVLDGSALTKIGKSLNDFLLRGPNFLCDLGGLLLRFRLDPIGLISDLEKAFLMVELQESERDLTRFLWLKDPSKLSTENGNLQICRFKRVPFGFKTSSFLLAGSVWNLLDRAIGPEVPIAEKIRENIYVDNVITGTRSVSEAKKFYSVAKKLFAHGSMNLREWNSNSREVMDSIPEHDRDDRSTVKVLGMSWDKSPDTLSISARPPSDFLQAKNKRDILACVASIFDPLGLLSCLKVQGMIFLQELWRQKLGWDDDLPESLLADWQKLCTTFQVISSIKIPRVLCNIAPNSPTVLCVFSDASTAAFSTNIYLRSEQADGGAEVGLAFSKARLCPVAGLTIPKGELMGVFIGTRCANYVKKELGVNVTHTYFWTDSQCVLGWIRNEARDQGVFVTNRVTEILNNQDITFQYIPTDQNPADLCTKSRHPGFEMPWTLWFKGPQWLSLPIPQWPTFETSPSHESPILLAGGSNSKNLKNYSTIDLEAIFELDRYGSRPFMDLVRVTSWVLRFVHRVREKVRNRTSEARVIQTRSKTKIAAQKWTEEREKPQTLSLDELQCAQNLWLESVQRHAFPELFTPKIHTSNFAQTLKLKLGADNLLRSHGRLGESELTEEAKYPILLPPKSELTQIIVFSYHKRYLHSGVNYTLAHIRSNFWIPQGRKVVASVLKSCAHCRKFHAAAFTRPPMPNLPKERVSKSPPFTYTGVDYFGHFFFRTEQGESKAWVVLFTCFNIRAVHLELVPDMTAESLLCALRRFISRRGKPKAIYSDNAKQFKIMKKILKQAENNPLYNFIQSEGISWKFIPELSPWHGAAWERLVGVAKDSLKKALGKSTLNFEQLRTVLVEVEDVVNSRPLTFVNMSTADDDMQIITPQNFLSTGRSERLPILPDDDPHDPEYVPTKSTQSQIIQNWKRTQYYLNEFWESWHKQYLLSLRERHASDKFPKNKSQVFRSPVIGEVVLVKEERLPRGLWKLGRIVEVHCGRDSLVRSAKVKTADSKNPITRPVSLLFPLEVKSSDSTDNKENKNNNELLACEPNFQCSDSVSLSSSTPHLEESRGGLSSTSDLKVHASPSQSPCSGPCSSFVTSHVAEQRIAPGDAKILTRDKNQWINSFCGHCFYSNLLVIIVVLSLFRPTTGYHSHNDQILSPGIVMSDPDAISGYAPSGAITEGETTSPPYHSHPPALAPASTGARSVYRLGPDGYYHKDNKRYRYCQDCGIFRPYYAPICKCQKKRKAQSKVKTMQGGPLLSPWLPGRAPTLLLQPALPLTPRPGPPPFLHPFPAGQPMPFWPPTPLHLKDIHYGRELDLQTGQRMTSPAALLGDGQAAQALIQPTPRAPMSPVRIEPPIQTSSVIPREETNREENIKDTSTIMKILDRCLESGRAVQSAEITADGSTKVCFEKK